MCYYIKWNGIENQIDSYRQVRPIFPLDVIPPSAGMLSVPGQSGTITPFTRFPAAPGAMAKWYFWDFAELSNANGRVNGFLRFSDAQVVDMPAVNAFYAYSYPYSWSANTGREEDNTISMFFLTDSEDGFFHFYIIDKAWDGSGGNYEMSMSGTTPVFATDIYPIGAGQPPPAGPAQEPVGFYDGYSNVHGGVVSGGGPNAAATTYPGMQAASDATALPIMLRDDPWNAYTYNTTTMRYDFHWYWLECCTDGMIFGSTPYGPTAFNVSYEADCSTMTGLEQGTRISMYNWLGAPYTTAGAACGPPASTAYCEKTSAECGLAGASQWIHYDVPMDQTCSFTQGIQVSARPCEESCPEYDNCGECTAQLNCAWVHDVPKDVHATICEDSCGSINLGNCPSISAGASSQVSIKMATCRQEGCAYDGFSSTCADPSVSCGAFAGNSVAACAAFNCDYPGNATHPSSVCAPFPDASATVQNGVCDDGSNGGPGLCPLGTDCGDCGAHGCEDIIGRIDSLATLGLYCHGLSTGTYTCEDYYAFDSADQTTTGCFNDGGAFCATSAPVDCRPRDGGRCSPALGFENSIETDYLTVADRTCHKCSEKTHPYDCMCEPGCGWAPLEQKCISGTPDYPSDQSVTIVQWETKGCSNCSYSMDVCSHYEIDTATYSCDSPPPAGCCAGYALGVVMPSTGGAAPTAGYKCLPEPWFRQDTSENIGFITTFLGYSPGMSTTFHQCPARTSPYVGGDGYEVGHMHNSICHSCADVDAPKWQCFRAAYNEKRAYANVGLMDEYAVLPATSFTAGHQSGDMSSYPPPILTCSNMWYAPGTLADGSGAFTQEPVSSGVAFMAYGYPNTYSSNTGYEAEDAMVTFLVQDGCCKTYLLVLIDSEDGTSGFTSIDITTTGVVPEDPVNFLNDPHAGEGHSDALDSYTYSSTHMNGTISVVWADCCNDGFVIGPLTHTREWSVNLKVHAAHRLTGGLETFKIGTYDSYRNEVGFVSSSIQKVTHNWGGLTYDALECTEWCQRYTDCSACMRDEQCTFSAQHGGCVAADVYIYDYGCPRPMYAPLTRIMHRDAPAYSRESFYDSFDGAFVLRYGYDARLDMTCPCNTRYRYFATIYDVADGMRPVHNIKEPLRLNYQHTFVDVPTLGLNGTQYKIYSYLCVAQGTLDRDDCSPVIIDDLSIDYNPPPPSPPPPSAP